MSSATLSSIRRLNAELGAMEQALAAKRLELAAAEALYTKECLSLRCDPLAVLFPELASLIFQGLPVDSRLRCREVCRGWRAFLADVRFWQVCDLSATSGVARRTPALLRAACERALGTLRELDVSNWGDLISLSEEPELAMENLLPVLRANASSLLELRAWTPVENDEGVLAETRDIEVLLAAAPRLRLLELDASIGAEEAGVGPGQLPRLFSEPQFALLRPRTLLISAPAVPPSLDVLALADWAAAHTTLQRLELYHAELDSQPTVDAVVGLALSQLRHISLFGGRLSPASLPALTRMLESRTLTKVCIVNINGPLLIGAAAPAFCTALRASRLVRLDLCSMSLWESLADGLAVVAACTGHPTLREVSFEYNGLENAPDKAAIDAALDALEASVPGLRLTR